MGDTYIATTQAYYDSAAHEIYRECWGGENHHLGLFDTTTDFYEAAARANENLVGKLSISRESVILDVGSGFCGLPRYIARKTPCREVFGLNLSERENKYARQKNAEVGLDDRIRVVDGNFNDMPFSDNSFDILVSQDAMLHSPDKGRLIDECARVLKPGGQFVYSDILERSTLGRQEAKRLYSRINVSHLATFDMYEQKLKDSGFEVREIVELGSKNLGRSYQAVHDIVEEKRDELVHERGTPDEIVDSALAGLRFWVEKAFEDKISWGLFVSRLLVHE